MFAERVLVLCLSICGGDIEVEDKVVALSVAPLMDGPKQVAEVQPGVELTADAVKGRYVLVQVKEDGELKKGWVLDSNLLKEPKTAFAKLVVHYLYDRDARQKKRKADEKFASIDGDRDKMLDKTEFCEGVKKQTLDDLNRHLQQMISKAGNPSPGSREYVRLMMDINHYTAHKFEGWRPDWMLRMREAGGPPIKVAMEFRRTRDVRRSRLARELMDPEPAEERARKAEALFAWADKDADKKLSRQEVFDALSLDSAEVEDDASRTRPIGPHAAGARPGTEGARDRPSDRLKELKAMRDQRARLDQELSQIDTTIKPGDEMVVLCDTQLKAGQNIVGPVRKGEKLSIEKIQDKWLWAKSGQMLGWIDKKAVISPRLLEWYGQLPEGFSAEAAGFARRKLRNIMWAIDSPGAKGSTVNFNVNYADPCTAAFYTKVMIFLEKRGEGKWGIYLNYNHPGGLQGSPPFPAYLKGDFYGTVTEGDYVYVSAASRQVFVNGRSLKPDD